MIFPQSKTKVLTATSSSPIIVETESMNLRDRFQELLEFQKTNPTVEEVYERFYDENVIVQENLNPPRVGTVRRPLCDRTAP